MTRSKLSILICLWFFRPLPPLMANSSGTGLEVSIAVDSVAEFKVGKDSSASDTLSIREAELSLFAPIDHRFDGVLSMAAHRENGVSVFEIHEGVISSNKLLSGLSVRAGQFFLGIGRLNRVHRHDWPFIKTPKVFQEFFGSEGILDSGLEASYLFPMSFFLDLTAGITNGWTFGHSHNEGKKPITPTHYARLGTFLDGGEALNFAIGLNYLGRKGSEGDQLQLFGIDGAAKGGLFNCKYLVQTETWVRRTKHVDGDLEDSMGAYFFPQVNLSKSIKAGIRFDHFTVLSLKDVSGKNIANSDNSFVPTFTYDSSEFASFKLAYNHSVSTQESQHDHLNRSIQFQMVFILGAHPAHEF